MVFPEMYNTTGVLDPFAVKGPVASSATSLPANDPFSTALQGYDPLGGIDQNNLGLGGGGPDVNGFLKALGGVKMPAPPAVQAPPRAPDPPKGGTIPGGLQQLLAMLAPGQTSQVPPLRL